MRETNRATANSELDMPMFSVIMPCYNHVRYVDQAVSSVRDQSCNCWELLVIDDGSTDGSAEKVQAHADQDVRIRLIRQSRNAGPAAARNAGLVAARGDWLAFLDSDDVWYPTTLDAYRKAITRRPAASFFYGRRDRLDASGAIQKGPVQFQDHPTGTAELFGRMFLSTMVVCFARSLLDRTDTFDEGLRSCEDYELFLRLSLLTEFHPIAVSTGLRRRHEENISRQTGFSRFQEAEVLRRFVRLQGGGEVLSDAMVSRRLARLYYASGRQYLKTGLPRKALVALRESIRYRRNVKASLMKAVCGILPSLGSDDGRDIPWLTDRDREN